MPRTSDLTRAVGALALAAGLMLPGARAAADDTVLFSANVAPNVLLLLDNSGSMNNIIWHEDFDPTVVPSGCSHFTDGDTLEFGSDSTETHCGNTRTIFVDKAISENTRYWGRYLNWYFSDAADAAYAEINQDNNAFPSSCVGGNSFAKYKRSRLTTAKQAIKDIICEVNQVKDVKFGFMTFRDPDADDPNGGFVRVPVDYYDSNQASDISSKLQDVEGSTWTPLAESLFQGYTYFMSRTSTDRPVGKDGSTVFPAYEYNTSKSGVGGANAPSKAPPSPVEFTCQKNFMLIITDGEPTRDDFDVHTPTDTALGFSDFKSNLIGDFNPDGETEEPGGCTECSFYIDDVARFMQTQDFRPDMADDQLIDTYTVGFASSSSADALLAKTAAQGNGLFIEADDSDELAQAIIDAFTDIIRKSQSFTAATVPATRTSAGENLYVSRFVPSSKTPYWEGHIENYLITGDGEIHDANGNCAVDDPSGDCFSGPIKPGAVPFWDAGEEVPLPGAPRKLSTTKLDSNSQPTKVPFDMSLQAADLGVVYPPAETYPGSSANNAEGLTDEIVQNVRGCKFGTGVQTSDVDNPQPCDPRDWRLGDIFHSNPVVVGPPSLFLSETSYEQFSSDHSTRDKMLYAGANDGFLRGFLTGEWDANTQTYDHGTGEEVFGFMPWPGRKNVRHLPIDTNGRDYYFVDGTPTVSDAWFYDTPTQTTKASDGSEWRTVLAGGMREGGPTYYALDVTDPSDSSFPGYLWEFPAENAPSSITDYVGETWGEVVITRIHVNVGTDDCGGEGCERWVAVVTGGYHPNGDPNRPSAYDSTATEGRAIFVLDLKTGEILAEKKFTPSASGPQADMVYAFASTPGVYDLDGDSYGDVIYVGDLGGNLWKWVISPVGEDRVNDGSGVKTQPNWPFRKFFSAPVAPAKSGVPEHFRSFFFPPAATFHEGKLWLAFGSGERENLNYEGEKNRDDENRFYAMTDLDPEEQLGTPLAKLTEGDLDDVTTDESCALLSSSARGYFFKGEEGEKFVTNVDVFQHFVFVGSFVPTENTDPCTTGGESRLYSFRINCGEGFFEDGSGDPDREITIGAGMPTDARITLGTSGDSSHRAIVNKQDGGILNMQAPGGLGAGIGQFYWRELKD